MTARQSGIIRRLTKGWKQRPWLVHVVGLAELIAIAAVLVYAFQPPYELQAGAAFGPVHVVLTGWPAAITLVAALYGVGLTVERPILVAARWAGARYVRVGFRIHRRWPIKGDRVTIGGRTATVIKIGRAYKTRAPLAMVQLDGSPNVGWVYVAQMERAS